MSNYELNDDWVVSIPIVTQNSAGVAEPAPSGDVYTAVSSNPASLNVVVGFMADGTTPAVVMNALVQASPGITVTLTDSAGLIQIYTDRRHRCRHLPPTNSDYGRCA